MNRRSFMAAAVATSAVLASANVSHAISDADAETLVRSVTDRVIRLITAPTDRTTKEEAFKSLMEESADLRQVAGFAVGRYARSMSPAQKDRYVEAFKSFIARTYVKRFDEYQGETISVLRTRDGGNRGVLVESEIARAGQPPLAVGWLVNDRSGRPLIADLQVEGISMAQSQRSEFTAMIDERSGNIDRFIADLEGRVGS